MEEVTDGHSVVGYTLLMDCSLVPEEHLERRKGIFRVHANDFPENTHWAFSDITAQLPSRLNLTHHFCSTARFAVFLTLHKMPEITGWTY